MSVPAEAVVPSPVAVVSSFAPAQRLFDRAIRWVGDHLNPILVKETRQALKSKQFLITFLLLLVCAWIWTFLGVAWIGPDVYYTAQGADLFIGYFAMLAFAMFVIVPFGAFRSLAGEQEDRTFALLSITTLTPRQIVSGKLGSAVLQMLIYLSSITPCLAFTYMLRGIDLPSILIILFYTVLASLGLSVIALLIATVSSEKHWQVMLSVMLIVGLLWCFGMSIGACGAVLSEMEGMFGWKEFWIVNGAIVSAFVGYFTLFFYAAAAQLTFSTDNRSTKLRVVMLGHQLLFTAWIVGVTVTFGADEIREILAVMLMILGCHWYVMGALMTGESPELSPRVRRQLPQSFLGRALLTWFNPGPGTGYMFALANMAGALVFGCVGLAALEWFGGFQSSMRRMPPTAWFAVGLVVLGYLAFYLGLGLIVVRMLRRVMNVPIFLTLLLHVLILLFFMLVPVIVQALVPSLRGTDYTSLHLGNPFMTVAGLLNGSRWMPWLPEGVVMRMALIAGVIFLVNLPAIAREVSRLRVERPKRVAEEDTAAALAKSPPKPVKLSPWD